MCGSADGCAVDMELVATLSPPARGGIFSPFSEVLKLRDGRYLVVNDRQPGEIEVYSPAGQYLETAGTRGDGPGEFQYIREMLHGDADSIIISDITAGRVTVLAPDLTVGRTMRLPYRHRELQRVDGGYVISGGVATSETAGRPLHYVDEEGGLHLSFGADTAIQRPELIGLTIRPLTTDGRSRVWAGYAGRYTIERFDLTGTLQQSFSREPDWFQPWTQHPPLTRDEPPLPQLTRIQVSDSTLWTLVLVPAPHFERAFELIEDDPDGRYRIANFNDLYHSVIEVFDWRSGDLLASEPVPAFLFVFADENHVVGYREGSDLLPRLDVWKFSLRGHDQ